MLFLMNNAVLDLSNPAQKLQSVGFPVTPQEAAVMEIPRLTAIIQEATFYNPRIARTAPDHAAGLAALVHFRLGANAALALRQEGANVPAHVYVRFRTLEDSLLEHMQRLQRQGMLTFPAVQVAVWAKAA